MKHIWKCRRTFVSMVSLGALVVLGLVNHADVAGAIATVAVGLAAANAGEAAMGKKKEAPNDVPA
jgi:NhaP-type Na+/H+ or K+/H+ antiporter